MAVFVVACVRSGASILLPNTAIQVTGEMTYAELWEQDVSVKINRTLQIETITVRLFDPASTSTSQKRAINIDSLSHPLSVGLDLSMRGVEFVLTLLQSASFCVATTSVPPEQNAFSRLMAATTVYSLPKKTERVQNACDKLHNDFIEWCGEQGAGWSTQGMDSASSTIRAAVNTLWYIEPHHDRLKQQGTPVPHCFSHFQGYRDFKKLHRRKPMIEHAALVRHCNELATCLSLPSLQHPRNSRLAKGLESLLVTVTKYRNHLKMDSLRHATRRSSEEGMGPESELKFIAPSPQVPAEYREIDLFIEQVPTYEPVTLDGFTPADRVKRRQYVSHLSLSTPVMMYRVAYGGALGTLNFLWKIQSEDSEVDRIATSAAAIEEVKKILPKYTSRALCRDFLNKYSSHVNAPLAVLRHMFKELTGSDNAAETEAQSKIEDRVANFFLSSDDPDLLLDLRSTGNNRNHCHFEDFFTEVESYLEEQLMSVQERRHGQELYLPMAISVEDLIREVKKRLPDNTPIPCAETVRLQFHPLNEHTRTASRYTGRFAIKFRVQTRMARLTHQDQHYVATQYKYLKQFAVANREDLAFVCLDDKAVVPVGEPGVPISSGVRSHNKVLAPVDGPQLVAADHDFHTAGMVPSVSLIVNVPEDSKDSFFAGQVCATIKDKIFQASTPMRHAAELLTVLNYLPEGTDKPLLAILTDDGPDHRLTYETVKLSLLAVYMELDLDMLVALRTAPHASWMNPAERSMAVLNLALQHISLQRDKMEEKFETKMKGKSTMAAVRNTAEYINGFKDAYLASMNPVIDLVRDRFERMQIKEVPIKTFQAADDDELDSVFNVVLQYAGCEKLATSKEIKSCAKIQAFIRKHAKATHYCFQLRKCHPDIAADCDYCCDHPLHMSEEEFANTHYLPDPTPDQDNAGHGYMEFSELYGRVTTEKHRPSLLKAGVSPEAQEKDKENVGILKAGKVRGIIKCCDCGKTRCIYSAKKLTTEEDLEIKQRKEHMLFVCGDPFTEVLVTRAAITCATEMETAYYSSSESFPNVCTNCGSDENLLDDFDELIAGLYEKYSVVRPFCSTCEKAGKHPKTWGMKFFKKQRTN